MSCFGFSGLIHMVPLCQTTFLKLTAGDLRSLRTFSRKDRLGPQNHLKICTCMTLPRCLMVSRQFFSIQTILPFTSLGLSVCRLKFLTQKSKILDYSLLYSISIKSCEIIIFENFDINYLIILIFVNILLCVQFSQLQFVVFVHIPI